MNKEINDPHLKEINVKNLFEFKNECFSCFASSTTKKHKLIMIGVNGHGAFTVIKGKERFDYSQVNSAIEKYIELYNE